MSFRSIHAPAAGHADDQDILAAAASLAALEGGRLTVISAFTPPAVRMAYAVPPNLYVDPGLIEQLEADHEALKAQVREQARAAASAAGLTGERGLEIAEYDAGTWESAPRWTPLTDLVVVGPRQARDDLAANLLLHARAPVLVVRPGLKLESGVAAIAWDGGLPAGRAVRAAIPLLRRAARIVVLQHEAGLHGSRRAAADPARLVDYLQLHDLSATVEAVPDAPDTGEALIDGARCCGADVMVCGGYGHSRAAETILGGVTRTVLHSAFPSVLLAH